MSRHRRRVLTAMGATLIGGCSAPSTDRVQFTAHTRHETTIGFVGDAMLGRNVDDRYGRPGIEPAAVWGDLRPRLQSLDGVCCNLECCLSTRGERYPDRTYYFRADPDWAVPALEAGNVQFASVANNHMLDYGPTALRDTVDALADSNIGFAGAGENPTAAAAPATVSIGGLEVAVVSFADHYAAYGATDDRPGTAYVDSDPDEPATRRIVGDALARAKAAEPDLLVASVHWGPNWVEYPDDDLVAFAHWLVDQGVDLVHGHSAHVFQGVERYGDGLILHDTGDIVDDYVVKDDLRNDRSLLFEAGLEDGSIEELRLVPIEIGNMSVVSADDAAATWLRDTMRERSTPFGTTYERDGDDLVLSLS
ncbi:CapA family protein [Haloterrigena sp. H1]|uniref:CapA family protein n=1 Tax=Haloterrigena sp. H1 TaxID=2552943 RepID=UPI00110D2FF8|nr:CapA family protein [Haloterrigena sp. H1]TMT85206.1 CapA family protein [Haloterrigena sp. H1]